MGDTLTHAVKPLQEKAQVIYKFFTIPINTCYGMYYKYFDEDEKKYFSGLISEINVKRDPESEGGLILYLGAPGTRFTSVDTPFCNALMGFYQLIIDIKTHLNNRGRVKIEYKSFHGGLKERTDECLNTPVSYHGDIIDMRDSAMPAGGSKSRRKPARKTRRGRIRKSKSKTHRRRRAHHSRLHARKHKKYTRKH
jgi:hypothetical protein